MATIQDILRKDYLALRPTTTLEQGVEALFASGYRGALVIDDDGHLCGVFTESTLLDVVFDVAARFAPVSEFMARTVHVLAPTDSLELAAQMCELYGVAQLPVLEDDNVVGVVTRRDLVRYVLQQDLSLRSPLASWIQGLPELAR